MASLPREIYRDICNDVAAKRDLCAIARVSSFMRLEAERLIYRDVETGFGIRFPPPSVVLRLLQRVCASDGLASYIQSFKFTWAMRDCLLATINLLSRSLRRMTRLQQLSLEIPLQSHPRTNIFEHCTFKLLFLDFAWLGQHHNRFIETQTRLQTLKVCGIGDQLLTAARSHPAKILPNLTLLSMDPKFAACLVPGRSITHMWLHDHVSPELLTCLAFANTPSVELGLKVYWRDGSDIEALDALAGFVPGLAGLHVIFAVEDFFEVYFCSLFQDLRDLIAHGYFFVGGVHISIALSFSIQEALSLWVVRIERESTLERFSI
jgi:hypothetical protein